MKNSSSLKFEYADQRLYNVCDVIKKFPDYFNISFDQMLDLFLNYNILSKKNISQQMKSNEAFSFEKEVSLESRMIHYRMLMRYNERNKILNFLSQNGIYCLMLLNYLKRLDDCAENLDLRYEEQFANLGFFHYHSILHGKSIKKILIILGKTLKHFEFELNSMNHFEKLSEFADISSIIPIEKNINYLEKLLLFSPEKQQEDNIILERKILCKRNEKYN